MQVTQQAQAEGAALQNNAFMPFYRAQSLLHKSFYAALYGTSTPAQVFITYARQLANSCSTAVTLVQAISLSTVCFSHAVLASKQNDLVSKVMRT